MYVVGARFRSLAAAGAALLAVRSAVSVAPGDAGIRALGTTRYDEPLEEFLLAGRFADDEVETVIGIVESQGGEVIERRRDAPRVAAPPRAVATSNPPFAASWMPPRTAHRTPPVPSRRAAAARTLRPRKRLRRPSAPLRVRAARAHRFR